jgi:hypothetical protein
MVSQKIIFHQLISLLWFVVGRDSVVGTVTRYGLDGVGVESRWVQDFPRLSRPALGLPIRL